MTIAAPARYIVNSLMSSFNTILLEKQSLMTVCGWQLGDGWTFQTMFPHRAHCRNYVYEPVRNLRGSCSITITMSLRILWRLFAVLTKIWIPYWFQLPLRL